jgi:sugar-specific transcriptional regulator TrmB
MTIDQELKGLGLRENETKVFLAILQLGDSTIGKLEKETELHKQLIYMAATTLQKRGLVDVYEAGGRRHFKVSNPAALEERLSTELKRAKKITPLLFELQSKKTATESARVYRGRRGFLQYNIEGLRNQPKGSEVLIISYKSSRYFDVLKKDSEDFARYEQLRIKRKVTFKSLAFASAAEEMPFYENRPLVKLRLLTNQAQPPMDVIIFYNRVGLYFYGQEPRILDLSGQETVNGFRSYFELLWKDAKAIK